MAQWSQQAQSKKSKTGYEVLASWSRRDVPTLPGESCRRNPTSPWIRLSPVRLRKPQTLLFGGVACLVLGARKLQPKWRLHESRDGVLCRKLGGPHRVGSGGGCLGTGTAGMLCACVLLYLDTSRAPHDLLREAGICPYS